MRMYFYNSIEFVKEIKSFLHRILGVQQSDVFFDIRDKGAKKHIWH